MLDEFISPLISDYCDRLTHAEPKLLADLKEETCANVSHSQMLSGRVEGRLLKMLVQLVGVRHALEIGTYTGYSALSIAEGLTHDGHLITCDINEDYARIARSYFAKSPVGHKITLKMGNALDTIQTLNHELDFVFVDADKEHYKDYYEAVLPRVRSGGLIVFDNSLWSGRVLSPRANDPETRAIAEVNELVAQDKRVENVLLSVRDGINLVRKI